MDFEPFLHHFSSNMECSDQTIRTYRSDLKLFDAFLQKYSIHRLGQIDHTIITNFIQHMREMDNPRRNRKGLSDATIGRRLSSLSSYFEYVRATSKAKFRNPLRDLPRNKWKKNKDPKPVDDLVLDLLIPGMTNLRDRTLFTLFLATGLRISEMWQLDRNSIIIAEVIENGQKHIEGSGKVLGKGRKIRTFFVDEETLVLYSEYLATRTDDNPALFLSERKQRMSVRAIQYTLQTWCKRLAAPHINVHRLRHTFATRLINGDISAMVLRELMGHESFTTTLRYVKISEKKLARGYFSAMEYQTSRPVP
jgi:site-specific recombinase XerD